MIVDPERYANEYELDAKVDIDSKRESGSVPIVAMRLWLRAAHAVVELTGPTDGDGKTFGSDGNVSLWLHKSDLALGNVLLDRISSENAKLRELVRELWFYAEQELVCDSTCQYGAVCDWRDCVFRRSMRELGVDA